MHEPNTLLLLSCKTFLVRLRSVFLAETCLELSNPVADHLKGRAKGCTNLAAGTNSDYLG